MRTFDLAPLYRSTVGFDRLFSLFDQVAGHDGARHDGAPGYPPYNIERTGENEYRITVAVAGFSEADIHRDFGEWRGPDVPATFPGFDGSADLLILDIGPDDRLEAGIGREAQRLRATRVEVGRPSRDDGAAGGA